MKSAYGASSDAKRAARADIVPVLVLLLSSRATVTNRSSKPRNVGRNLTEVSSHDETGSALKKKNCLITLQHGPLSARGELQSHPLAVQAQACGSFTKGGWAGGPDGTYRDHWCLHRRKKTFLTRHHCAGCHVNLSVSFHGRSSNCV